MITPVNGLPGLRAAKTANHRIVFLQAGPLVNFAGGRIIDGTKSRDVANTDDIARLQAGLVMGKITASGKFANSIIALSQGALTGTGTTLTTSAAIATEIARRIGTSGTFKLTGPPTAAGTVRTVTVTFSAVNTTTGDITITAAKTNEVQRIDFGAAATAGNLALQVPLASGGFVTTGTMAWNATDATFLSNINTALDTATGVTGGIVATAIPATDTDLGIILTFSGTGYTGNTYGLVNVVTKPTSVTTAAVSRTTTGDSGAFVTNSLIQPTDGSETPLIFLPDGYPIAVTDNDGTSQDQPFPFMPVEAIVNSSQLVNWPADASLRTWLAEQLSSKMGGKYVFDHMY